MNAAASTPLAAPRGGQPDLDELLEEVAHLLPAQAPIRRFVHHNTLHHFEHLPFEEAVVAGGKKLGAEPFPKEAFFARALASGRILEADLEAVLAQTVTGVIAIDPALPFGAWTRKSFRSFRLRHVIEWPSVAKITYLIEEGEALERCWDGVSEQARDSFCEGAASEAEALASLWSRLLRLAPRLKPPRGGSSQENLEPTVHALLIRFCGAYLDQGISYWPLPCRDAGLYNAFLELYSRRGAAAAPWMRGLSVMLSRLKALGWSAREALTDALSRLGPERDWPAILERQALALPGWAGMIRQLEHRPDLAPVKAPPVALLDYFAIYGQLEAYLRERNEPVATEAPQGRHDRDGGRVLVPDWRLAYESFVLAQLAGFGPAVLKDDPTVTSWLHEVAEFPELERRRLLLLAFERRYRHQVLDAIAHHAAMGEYRASEPPRFQAVFCIDEREESLRRHLEEIEPRVETLAMAGFFGVAMVYQGWNDCHPLPLCPANQTPRTLVREEPLGGTLRPTRSRPLGLLAQTQRAGRNGVVSGGLLSLLGGCVAGAGLLGRTLFPGLFHRLYDLFEHSLAPAPVTRLRLDRSPEARPNENGLWEGFTVEEMSRIVASSLKTMGMKSFAPLLLIVGHGSSSLNNPHEAAHDCGATGGGRGGPNARALAAMANHPEVRRRLVLEGLEIPADTWVVGGYHNTCDDSMEYYDIDLVPEALTEELAAMQEALARACVMDAHERCRRFENVSLKASPEEAFRHVQERAVTLAQPRPEYGHCTNAICVVGRRQRTRGLFLDRRAFLVSYDPTGDEDGDVLGGLLESVGPVGAGINLEYYFSSIDNSGFGCGTKLPHNITGLLGVMDGHSSDLRTGLPWQMVELHEPMRLLVIVEALPETLEKILHHRPGLRSLIERGWIQIVAWSPHSPDLWTLGSNGFEAYQPESNSLPVVESSQDYYRGRRDHLSPVRVAGGMRL